MVRTHGLTHIALAVRDAERSLAFYQRLFGMVAVHRAPAHAGATSAKHGAQGALISVDCIR